MRKRYVYLIIESQEDSGDTLGVVYSAHTSRKKADKALAKVFEYHDVPPLDKDGAYTDDEYDGWCDCHRASWEIDKMVVR